MKIKLFVSHRIDTDSFVIKNNIITPVYCGAVYKKEKWYDVIIGDNTGDNISELRMSFNELTVQYWAWKNIDADYYGLCHYRRYFALKNENAGYINEQNQIYLPFLNKSIQEKYQLDNEKILQELCYKYDLIIPRPANVENIKAFGKQQTNVMELWQAHEGYFFDKNIIDLLLKTIKKIQPQFYEYALEYLNQNKHRGYNCYLMRKDLFCGMCEFQFSVLFEMKKCLEGCDNLKKFPRTLGYMGEMLFGIYLYYLNNKDTNIKEIRLLLFENTEKNKNYHKKIISFFIYYIKLIFKKYLSENTRKKIKYFYNKIYNYYN